VSQSVSCLSCASIKASCVGQFISADKGIPIAEPKVMHSGVKLVTTTRKKSSSRLAAYLPGFESSHHIKGCLYTREFCDYEVQLACLIAHAAQHRRTRWHWTLSVMQQSRTTLISDKHSCTTASFNDVQAKAPRAASLVSMHTHKNLFNLYDRQTSICQRFSEAIRIHHHKGSTGNPHWPDAEDLETPHMRMLKRFDLSRLCKSFSSMD